MIVYTNGFRCASNENSDEFTVQCLQITPAFNEKNEIIGVTNEIVASLVMTPQSARALAELIFDSPIMAKTKPHSEE